MSTARSGRAVAKSRTGRAQIATVGCWCVEHNTSKQPTATAISGMETLDLQTLYSLLAPTVFSNMICSKDSCTYASGVEAPLVTPMVTGRSSGKKSFFTLISPSTSRYLHERNKGTRLSNSTPNEGGRNLRKAIVAKGTYVIELSAAMQLALST